MHPNDSSPPQGYVTQLRSAGLTVFPCRVTPKKKGPGYDKRPAVAKGQDWRNPNATYTSHDYSYFGVPLPGGCLVLDLDSYKGGGEAAARAAVEAKIGAALPWDAAIIQRTVSGGEHYAFRMPDYVVSQGNGLPDQYLDLRVGGQGFIASGVGYSLQNFGVLSLSMPKNLPVLPAECRSFFENKAPVQLNVSESPLTPEAEEVRKALTFIDPDMPYDGGWIKIIMALRHYFDHDQDTGLTIAHEWSSGEYWAGGASPRYIAESVTSQYTSGVKARKVGGATITIGSLFHKAIEGGWAPPAKFDTSLAFGSGAADAGTFNALMGRIVEEGADSRNVEGILGDITTSGCNDVQALLLRNELKALLKGAGVLDKDLSAAIDRKVSPLPHNAAPAGMYGKSDVDNALLFLEKHYPDGGLIQSDGEHFGYTGKCWALLPKGAIDHEVTASALSSGIQSARITSTLTMVKRLAPLHIGGMNGMPPDTMIFDNGILDLNTGALRPHDKQYKTTIILPYAYDSNARCDEWQSFVSGAMEGDPDRIALLQEWMGYVLTEDYTHHKMLLLLGASRSGKSLIGRIMAQVLGDENFTGGSLSSLASDSYIASLRNKLVAFFGDAEGSLPPAKVSQVIERIKTISGNDAISFDRKFLSAMSETLPTRMTISANSVPRLFDDSGALAARLLVLPFNISHEDREDHHLLSRLSREVPGIALWAMEGRRRLKINGKFTRSVEGENESTFIKETYSPLLRFIDEVCVRREGAICTSAEVHAAYRVWCLGADENVVKRSTFVSRIRDAMRGKGVAYGPHRTGNGVVRGFKGLAIKEGAVGHPAFQPEIVK